MCTTLSETQHWFQKLVMRRPHEPALPLKPAEPDCLLVSTPGRSAAARLNVYQNAYQLRLLECLREEFPRVRRLAGEEGFEQLAAAYVDQHPSTHDNLGRLSASFEAFLIRTRPKADSGSPDWTDRVIDAARFETAIQRVFDGSGSEHRRGSGSRCCTAATTALALEVCPSVRLLTLQFPVHDVPAVPHEPIPPQVWHPPTEPTRLAIYRRDYVVRWLECDARGFSLLASLQQSVGLEDALTRACQSLTLDPAELFQRFRFWGDRGVVQAVPLH